MITEERYIPGGGCNTSAIGGVHEVCHASPGRLQVNYMEYILLRGTYVSEERLVYPSTRIVKLTSEGGPPRPPAEDMAVYHASAQEMSCQTPSR